MESTHQAENLNLSILTRHLDREGSDLGVPGGIRTRDALIKRKVAKPAFFWASSQRKLAANLFDSQTIRLTTADQIRLTTCPENVEGPDYAEPALNRNYTTSCLSCNLNCPPSYQ